MSEPFWGPDFEQLVRELALRHRPKMISAGATAYPRLIDFAAFRESDKELADVACAVTELIGTRPAYPRPGR